MAIFDFLFGRTKAQPTTTTTVQTSKLPEEIAPFVTQVLEEAKEQYDIAKERGYQPYPGETIAPRTQEEKEAIAGLRGLIGTQQPYQEEAEAALRGIDREFTAEQAEKFMSPYQQAVVDVEKRKAEEDFKRRILPEFERQGVGAGGMSGLGSRAGVQAARLGEAFGQQLGDIQAKGSQKAYQDAYRQFVDQGQRQREQAADLRGIGLQKFQTGLAEQGLGQKLAQEDRAETQAIFDKAFREYTEQEQYPESELAQLSSFVYGNPYLRQPDTTRTTTGMLQPTSSIGQGLLGLGLTGLNIYGRAGGFSPGGPSFNTFFNPYGKKYGGRVVQRQEGGEVPNVYNQGQQIGSGLSQLASPVGGGLFGSRSFLGGMFPRPRPRTNVIENIDNAAGSLNAYREAMDRDMKNLNIAARGISQSYGETFGNPLRRFMAQQQLEQQATPTVAEMKAGGGLRSLPVVKRQVSGPVDDTRIIEQLLEQDRQIDALSSRLSKAGLTSLDSSAAPLGALEQFVARYPKLKSFFSGEMAEKQAQDFDELQKQQLAELKKATPQVDRFAGLAEAARRVMGADPSKGFINALVQGMSGLDEGQREAYLKQKEQELKLLELKQKAEIKSLERKQAAETEGAKGPLKLAQLSKALKGTYRKFDPTVQKTLTDAAEKELGLQAQIIDGQVVSIKNRDGKDATADELRKFNRLFSKLVTGFARFDKTTDSAAEALSQTLRLIPGLKISKPIPSSGQDDPSRIPLPDTPSKKVSRSNSQNLVTSGG